MKYLRRYLLAIITPLLNEYDTLYADLEKRISDLENSVCVTTAKWALN